MRIASAPDLTRAARLLAAEGLPIGDLTGLDLQHFFYAGPADVPIGLVGLEIVVPEALLRSLVVDAAYRGTGVGSHLVSHAEQHARELGVASLYLLTTTAERFFSTRGYARIDRGAAPASIRATREFADICPTSSTFMRKTLRA